MKIGIIYKVENVLNGEVYIGATTDSLKERKRDHLKRAKREENNKFHMAMSVYGTWIFSWKQIDKANSINELAEKEKQYIIKYNSKEDGYNSDLGGGFKKTVYQYNLSKGELISSYDSLESAAYSINSDKKQISKVCLSVNKTFKGFYWSYNYFEPFKPNKDERKKKILCYNLKNKIKQEFNSVSEASREVGVNKTSIAKVCRGERKTAGGFIWNYI